ncbi:hypothetical protein AAKU67_003871 [Oxalobacteraceae bacterium GrIS 2.11]
MYISGGRKTTNLPQNRYDKNRKISKRTTNLAGKTPKIADFNNLLKASVYQMQRFEGSSAGTQIFQN